MSQLYRMVVEINGELTLDSDNLSMEQAQARREELAQSYKPRYLQIVPIDSDNVNAFNEEG